jgi:hypothetical protein
MLFLTASLFAIKQSDEKQVQETIVNQFYQQLPSQLPVVLTLDVDEYEISLAGMLKSRLIEDGYQLYAEISEEHYDIVLKNERRFRREKGGFFLVPRHYYITTHLFSYEVIHYPSKKTITFDTCEVETRIREKSTEMRWYDPILVSAVVGGLAYLFYFGNK